LLLKEHPSIFSENTETTVLEKVVISAKIAKKEKNPKNFNLSGLSLDNEKTHNFHRGKLARLKYKVNNIIISI